METNLIWTFSVHILVASLQSKSYKFMHHHQTFPRGIRPVELSISSPWTHMKVAQNQ